ncbi:MAG: O-antigen ligase family protein [Solirubrobacterales bacterium]
MHNTRLTPRPLVIAAVAVALLAFAVTLLIPASFPDQVALLTMPVTVVAALWLVPLSLALVRGERWAFVLALALLIFVTDASFRTRVWDDKSLDWQVMLKGLVWAGAGAIGLARLNRSAALLATPPGMFMVAFIGLMTLSSFWSPVPWYTLQSSIAYLWLLLFGLAAAQVLDEDDLLLALAIGCGLVVLPSLMVAPFGAGITPPSPGSTGEPHRLRGITDHPIPLAEEAALFTFAATMLLTRAKSGSRRLLLCLLVGAGIFTVLLTRSRIPPLAMAIAAAVFLTYRKGGWLLLTITALAAGIVLLLADALMGVGGLIPDDLLRLMSRSHRSGEVLSLSGRLAIWPYVLDRIAEAPLFGHGHAAGVSLFEGFRRWHVTHAHNAYLQTVLYLGLAGLALLAGVLATQIRTWARDPRPVRDILVLYMLLKGATEQSFLANMPSGAVALWMVTLGMAAVAWGKRTQRSR